MTTPTNKDLIKQARDYAGEIRSEDFAAAILFLHLAHALERMDAKWETLEARVSLSGKPDAPWFIDVMHAIEAKFQEESSDVK